MKSLLFLRVSLAFCLNMIFMNFAFALETTPPDELQCPIGYEKIDRWTGLVERFGRANSSVSFDEAYSLARSFAEEELVDALVTIFNYCDRLPGNQDFQFDPQKQIEPLSSLQACDFSFEDMWSCTVRVATSVMCCAEAAKVAR